MFVSNNGILYVFTMKIVKIPIVGLKIQVVESIWSDLSKLVRGLGKNLTETEIFFSGTKFSATKTMIYFREVS